MAHQKNKTNRRADLLQAARKVFAEKGFASATISEIVSQAGVAQGTFYLYFPSKRSIVIALAQEMQEQIEVAIRSAYAQTTTLQEMIDISVRGAFHIMGQYRDILSLIHEGSCWIEAPAERERIFAPYYDFIAELIRREQTRGIIPTTLNPQVTAILIVGLIYYTADECYLYNSSIPEDTYIAEAARFIRRALEIL